MSVSNVDRLKNDPRIRELARQIVPPTSVSNTRKLIGMPVHEFATKYFYLESGQLMTYIPHCFLILDIIFNPSKYGLGKISEVIYSAPKKSIKCLSVDTNIPTPFGWKKLLDIQEGDIVFDDQGKPCNVV